MTPEQMREQFEAWFEPDEHNRRSLSAFRTPDGEYTGNWYLNGCWHGWQAATSSSEERVKKLREALEGLMEVERRGRLMPIGREWDAARKALEETNG